MTDADARLARLVGIWYDACTDFVALVRTIPREQWGLPTDLEGWSVKDTVAHTAHLEAVLAGSPEETLEVVEAPHLRSVMSFYTERGVLARREHDLPTLADEIERAVATRYAALQADPPTDPTAAPPKTPGDAGWDVATLLSNRPFDVWMHEQDVRRAIDRPGGYDCAPADHALRTLGRGLPMVVGKRVAPPPGTTVRLEIPAAELGWSVRMGDDGRAALVDDGPDPDVTVRLSPEEYVVLGGGRRTAESTTPETAGDGALARRLLDALAVTP